MTTAKRRTPLILLALLVLVLQLLPAAIAPTTSDHAPDTETIVRGTTSGITRLLSDDGLTDTIVEGAVSTTEDFFPSTQTIDTGTQTGGSFPGDVDDSNDIRATYQEADQASTTDLTVDTETLTKAVSVSGTEANLDADDGTNTRVVREANQAPSDYQATLYPNADGYLNQWVTAGTPACATNGNWYDEVDDGAIQDDDTTCRQAASNNQIIAVNMEDAAITGAPADVDVCVWGYFEDDANGANTIRHLVRSGTTNSFSSTYSVPNAGSGYPAATQYCLDLDPADGLDWTDADIDAIQVGADTPDAAPDPRVTSFEMVVWANFTADYELELQYDWTAETCDVANTLRLTINSWRTGANMENVDAQVWDWVASAWDAAFTVTATADGTTQTFDLTRADHWNSGAPRMRFLGTTESGDTAQGDFTADYLVIRCIAPADYEAQWKYDWTGVTVGGGSTEHRLFVEGLQTANAETLDMRTYNADETLDVTIVCSITSTIEGELDCGTLSADQQDTGTPNVQYRDASQASEGSQSSWGLDRVRIRRTFNQYDATVQHDWTSVALADSYQFRVRASTTGEAFNPQIWDWQDLDWNAMTISVTAGVETLYTESLAVACTGAADDCERNTGTGAVRIRWLTPSSTDETSDVLTLDQEIVQRTDNDPTISSRTNTPASGTSLTAFDFAMVYTDVVTCPATLADVSFNSGGAWSALTATDGGDLVCSDGKAYNLVPDQAGFCPGTRTYRFRVSDGVNPTVTDGTDVTFTITNIVPSVTPDLANPTTPYGTAYEQTFADNDNDIAIACQTASWSVFAGPPECTIVAGTGALTCAGTLAPGDYAVTVRISDGTATADESFTLTVIGGGGGDPPDPPNPLPGLWELLRMDCDALGILVTCSLHLTEDITPLDIGSVAWTVDGQPVQGWRDGGEWRMRAVSFQGEAAITANVTLTNRLDWTVLRQRVPTHAMPLISVAALGLVAVVGAAATRKRRSRTEGTR